MSNYNWRQKPGPSDRQTTPNKLQVKPLLDDNKLIRRVIGKGNISGFGMFAFLVMAGVLYDDEPTWTRAEQVWTEMLKSATQTQLEQIQEGLTSLVVLTQEAMK